VKGDENEMVKEIDPEAMGKLPSNRVVLNYRCAWSEQMRSATTIEWKRFKWDPNKRQNACLHTSGQSSVRWFKRNLIHQWGISTHWL